MQQSQLAGFIIDCNTPDLAGAAAFWGAALHMNVRELPADEGSKYMRLVDPDGRLLRRSRLDNRGREVVLIDNRRAFAPGRARYLDLPPPVIRMPRERYIVAERKLRDEGRTLESLGVELGLSKERVRQLEATAFAKMRRSLESQSPEVWHFLA